MEIHLVTTLWQTYRIWLIFAVYLPKDDSDVATESES